MRGSMYDKNKYLFCDGDLFGALEAHLTKITQKVNAIPEDQFLATDDETLIQHVVADLEVQPIELHEDDKTMAQEEIQVDVSHRFEYGWSRGDERIQVPGVQVTVSIPFTGDSDIWKLRPNQWKSVFPRAHVRKPADGGVGYIDIIMSQTSNDDPKAFKNGLESTLDEIRFYLSAQKPQIDEKNKELETNTRAAVQARRERLEKHSGIAQLLDIPLKKRDGAPDISRIPIKRKLVKPLPPAPNKPPEPGINDADYEHILGVIRHEGISYETTPETFAKHDEEELRDIILAHLNGHYPGEATGETFRRSGKTDIRIEDEKRAAFVAECKVWRGASELSKAIDQLLSYLIVR